MKYCEDCGYECADDAKFCGLCGFAFGEMMVEQQVNTQKNTLCIRNIWSLVAAIFCLVPFFMDKFAVIKVVYYEISDNFIEFCQRYGDLSFCTSLGEKMVACVIAVLPLLIFVLSIVLVIGAFKAMHVIRGYLVTISIMATILMFFFVLGESGNVTFGRPLLILAIGLCLSAFSCTRDKPKTHVRPGTLMYGAETSPEGKKEWRCPKCDARNSIDYKFCKTCGTSMS